MERINSNLFKALKFYLFYVLVVLITTPLVVYLISFFVEKYFFESNVSFNLILRYFNHLDTILPSEDFKFEPTSYKIINDTKNKRQRIHLLIAKMTYWVVCVTKYRMKLKKHENVRWYEILRIVRTQLVGTIKVESVDGQVSSIRHSKEAESKQGDRFAF